MKKQISKELKTPQRLQPGDCVAVVAPSGKYDSKSLKENIATLRSRGYFVVQYPHTMNKDSFFSAPDTQRAQELGWALKQPAVKAILGVKGGYGIQRCLTELEKQAGFQPSRLQPKLIFGFSDLTYLHQWLQNRLGWRSFHAPLFGMLSSVQLKYFIDQVEALPTQAQKQTWSEVQLLRKGSVAGTLVGGNLSLLRTEGMAALPNQPLVLCVEEVNENFYEIDRLVWRLIDSPVRKNIKAVIAGSFSGCGKADRKSFGLKRLQQSFLQLTDGPVWWNARFGHGLQKQRFLAFGAPVKITGKSLSYLDGVVS